MTQIPRHFIIGLIAFCILFTEIDANTAVDSRGEINVQGDNQARVPASSTAALIMTLSIDRSLAEPGEDIKTIEIRLPTGFIVQPSNLRSVSRDGQPIAATAEVTGNALRIVLARKIDDFSNSLYEMIFDSKTPVPTGEVTFKVQLRNPQDISIGASIKPGNVDGKKNNDDFTLQIIPNVPPDAVQGFAVEIDPTGENDVTIRWQKSEDPDVNGYFIYRDTDPRIAVENRSATVFQDVNVTGGNHSYVIEAYKTSLLRSPRSEPMRVDVPEDRTPPSPPERLVVTTTGGEIKVTWNSSPTRDVAEYQIFFGALGEQLSPLTDKTGRDVKISADEPDEFIDRRPLGIGVFTYAIEAIDEAGNNSEQISQTLRILGEPFPNPFTPLSIDTDFSRIVFPARALEDAEGEFIVLIFDVTGVLVRELKADPGGRELEWDGKDEDGEIVESGVYVYQMQVGGSFKTGTLIVAK